jgi:hypothetical protein
MSIVPTPIPALFVTVASPEQSRQHRAFDVRYVRVPAAQILRCDNIADGGIALCALVHKPRFSKSIRAIRHVEWTKSHLGRHEENAAIFPVSTDSRHGAPLSFHARGLALDHKPCIFRSRHIPQKAD